MRKKIIDFTDSSEDLIRFALKYKEKKDYSKALELLKKAIDRRDSPQAFIEYAKILSLYNWGYPMLLLSRATVFFPDNIEIRRHLIFVIMMRKDTNAYKLYTNLGQNIPFNPSDIDTILPQYEEALLSNDDDEEDYGEAFDFDELTDALFDKSDDSVSKSDFKLVTDFDAWLFEQDESVKQLLNPSLNDYSVDALELYIDKKLKMNSPFKDDEKALLGHVLEKCAIAEINISERVDGIASKMLEIDLLWAAPLFIKGNMSMNKTDKDKDLAKRIIERIISSGALSDSALEEYAVSYCVNQGLYDEVCRFYEKHFDSEACFSAEIEAAYAEAAFMSDKYADAEKSLIKLSYLDPFSLSYFADLMYSRLLKDNSEEWKELKDYYTNGFVGPCYAPKKLFDRVSLLCGDRERIMLAAVMLKNPMTALSQQAEDVYKCRLLATDAWLGDEKSKAFKFLFDKMESGKIVYTYERVVYNIVINKKPKLDKVFLAFMTYSVSLFLPLTEGIIGQVVDILEDMNDRLIEYGLMPKRFTDKWIRTATLVVFEKLGINGNEILAALSQFGISEKSYLQFKEALYN